MTRLTLRCTLRLRVALMDELRFTCSCPDQNRPCYPLYTVLFSHLGQKMTLHTLLASKKIFAFIQQSQAGGCKIICQHDDPTIICSKGKSDKQHPCAWFSANIIGVDKDQLEQLDWNTKKFELWWTYKLGTESNLKNSRSPSFETVGKQWTANWRIQKDDKSVVSKLSTTNESMETIRSQLTTQQQENKKLMGLMQKLQDNASLEQEKHKKTNGQPRQTMEGALGQGNCHMDRHARTGQTQFEMTTNQTIKMYESTNDRLRQENELIKARYNSQAKQQNIMQQQIATLLAQQSLTSQHTKPHSTDQDLKRDTPTTPTAMSGSPERVLVGIS
jgi:hypothetical protein